MADSEKREQREMGVYKINIRGVCQVEDIDPHRAALLSSRERASITKNGDVVHRPI